MKTATNNPAGRMILTQLTRILIAVVMCLALSTFVATAQTSFVDDFEGDLSQWVGKGGGAHSGFIVPDPVRANNRVVTFAARKAGGDIFGLDVTVTPGLTYILEFDEQGRRAWGRSTSPRSI